ncbi:MAG TPA: hypothetical protein V6C65_24965 [Allocoleopsis sp.]
METKAISSQWVIAKKDPQNLAKKQTYAMVWIAEAAPTQRLVQSAQQLSKTKNLFPGVQVTAKTSPEFGFLIEMQPGWHLQSEKQFEDLLEKIVWELNRLSR